MDEKKVESIIFSLKETISEQKAEIERLTEENGWLSKECNKTTAECAELQKQVDELKEQFLSTCENCHLKKDLELLRYQKEQAVKDTAKEIMDMFIDENIQECIAERYGVEVE